MGSRKYDYDKIRALSAQGLTRSEVASRIGCDPSLVTYACRYASDRKQGQTERRQRLTERRAEAVAEVDQGADTAEVAERYGVKRNTLYKWCAAAGVSLDLPNDPTTRAEILDAVLVHGWTARDLADEYERTLATGERWVRWCRRHGEVDTDG